MTFLVVLDRDGVINEDFGYVHKKEDFVWKEGIFDVLRLLQELGGEIHVATNQSGIARGMYSREQFLTLSSWMTDALLDEGIKIWSIQNCEHLPASDGTPECFCRKPQPGMLYEASRVSGLPAREAVMIGDQFSDVLAAKAAGFRAAVLVGSRISEERRTENFAVHRLKDCHHLYKRLKALGVDYFGSHLDSISSAGE